MTDASRLFAALLTVVALVLAGCESIGPVGKRIDYKSTSAAPPLELPPELSQPRYDDRFAVSTASGLAAANAARPNRNDLLPSNPDARIARAGNERWIVAKATPEQAWSISRQYWTDTGFVVAVEQPTIGVMETDWAENRADMPSDFLRSTVGKYLEAFTSTYKRDKFRTRIERGAEPGTVEIYVSHRGMEQVPTVMMDNRYGAGFAWAVMPPNPNLEAEMLQRLMMRFGAPESQTVAATAVNTPGTRPASTTPDRARVEKGSDGVSKLIVDDPFDRAWRRVGLALDRSGFTVVDRDRSSGVYFVRYADPDSDMTKKDREESWLAKLAFWKKDEKDKPEQYRIKVVEAAPASVVSVQDPKGDPDRTQNSEKILALLKDQLK
ncbi:MAG TPA: outer membrane protein assembly factor BamC [Casimicrobiaceae bacterium]|nr:outer membrane protein assembly factor BamC [Casimicrobiaceae bacterium]